MKPASERLPRATFQRRLERILEHIDASPSFVATWKDWFFHNVERATFRVTEVNVVGSFARGALHCGDLDLVVTIEVVEGRIPPTGVVAALVARRAPRVQVHVGTPKENSSHAPFPEARRLWSTKNRDWRKRVSSLPLDPAAGRFDRKTDRLPLRLDQLRMYDFRWAETVADRIASQELTSRWHDLSAITPSQDSWPIGLVELHRHLARDAGRETARLLPFAIQHVVSSSMQTGGAKKSWHDSPTAFSCGAAAVRIGRPTLDVDVLDELRANVLLLVPHKSARGPNGIWELSRGPAHPVAELFGRLAFWTLLDAHGIPILIEVDQNPDSFGATYHEVDLFTTKRGALEMRFDDEDKPVLLKGGSVADAVVGAEMVSVDNTHSIARVPHVKRYATDEALTPQSLASLLATMRPARSR